MSPRRPSSPRRMFSLMPRDDADRPPTARLRSEEPPSPAEPPELRSQGSGLLGGLFHLLCEPLLQVLPGIRHIRPAVREFPNLQKVAIEHVHISGECDLRRELFESSKQSPDHYERPQLWAQTAR